MVMVGFAVVDMRQIGAELVVGNAVSVRLSVGSSIGQATYSKSGSKGARRNKTGPRGARFAIVQIKERLPLFACRTSVDVLADLVLGDAVALLDLAFELVALAGDDIEVVVRPACPTSL